MALKRVLAENMTRVRDMFAKWDTDGDGTISIKELARALAAMCIPIDGPALKRLFQQVDKDGSGCIEFSELHELLTRDVKGGEDVVSLAKYGPSASGVRQVSVSRGPAGTLVVRPASSPALRNSHAASAPSIGLGERRPASALPTASRRAAVSIVGDGGAAASIVIRILFMLRVLVVDTTYALLRCHALHAIQKLRFAL